MKQSNFRFIISKLILIFIISSCSASRTYEGGYLNGKYHGQGVINFSNGDRYVGSFQYGKYDGYGTYYWRDGGKLAGTFHNDQPTYGTENYSGKWKGDKYIGNFKNWKKYGEGIYYFSNGNKYEGNWKNDKYDGLGVFTNNNGKITEGFWKNGSYQYYSKVKDTQTQKSLTKNEDKNYFRNLADKKLCDNLKLYKNYKNSFTSQMTFYDSFLEETKRRGIDCGLQNRLSSLASKGLVNKNKENNTNTLRNYNARNNKNNNLSRLPNCSKKTNFKHLCFGTKYTKKYKYTGEFKNNLKHGKGKYEWIANDQFKGYIYVGEYLNDKRHGQGKAIWANGQKYVGQYIRGNPEGLGHYKYSNGDYYIGEIKNNKRNGEGVYFYIDGRKQEGIWKNGKFMYAQKTKNTEENFARLSTPNISSAELNASKQEVERERNKRIELERRLASLLAKQKEERDIIDADIRVPILEIISNKTKGKRGTIRGLAKDNVQVVEVTVDGKEVNISSNGNFEYSTYVPPSGVKLKIEVTDAAGLTTSKIVELKGNLELASPTISFDRLNPLSKKVKSNPNALALIVGVSKYENTNAKAMYADNDALVFKDYAIEKLGIRAQKIKVLINNKADEKEILLSIKEWLRRSAKPNQSDIYIFFAGHGLASDNGKNMYLLPYDGSPRLLEKTAILLDEMFSDIKETSPRSVTVFLDTCYSGVTRNEEMLISGRPIVIKAKEQAIPDGFTLFSAASNEQISRPLEEAKHGMFSYFLMKGMEGDADANNDNKITARELHAYVEQNVVQQSSGSQTPELQGDKDRVLVQFN